MSNQGSISSFRTIKFNHLFLVDDLDGNIPQNNIHGLGFYYMDTRFVNRFELMNTVFEIARPWDPSLRARLTAAKSKDFPTPAQRPLCTQLDTSLLEKEHGIALRPWRNGVEECLRRLYER